MIIGTAGGIACAEIRRASPSRISVISNDLAADLRSRSPTSSASSEGGAVNSSVSRCARRSSSSRSAVTARAAEVEHQPALDAFELSAALAAIAVTEPD